MRRSSLLLFVALLLAISCFASGPADRQPTDPKSIASPASPDAKPVPIEDLFYSRRITNQSWSPDGKEIVITTNFTGRFNLWKVSANGGWPIQLLQSDDRQSFPLWSPDGKWIAAHYYPQEGHGFAKRENQIDALKRIVDWFDKYMKAAPSGTSGQ